MGIRCGGEGDYRRTAHPHAQIIINNNSNALPVADGGIDRAAEVDKERFVNFIQEVALDDDGDGLAGDTWGKGQCAGRGGVVGRSSGGVVGGGEVDGDGLAAGGREGDGEDGIDRTGIALGDGDIVDG